MEEMEWPEWYLGRGKVDEAVFARDYLSQRELISVDGSFFDLNGRVHNENILRREICDILKLYVRSGIARRVESILEYLRIVTSKEELAYHADRIHVANGTFLLGYGFMPMKEICRYRLPVNYNPDAPKPKAWLAFLDDLLEEEDIWTLQQYMGYCLIPTTRAQKMLLITGRGGEGKSRIGVVMKALFGCNMSIGSLAKVETNQFARADLEHLLVLVDDDLKMEALNQTNYIKSIITSELPMDLERKGIQSYQGLVNARFMAFGNGTLQALHDRSHGFFRRQIILSAKERRPDRVDDPYLAERLKGEIEGIFNWCLEGLYCLGGNDYQFDISEKTRENMRQAVADGNNVVEFMQSEGYFRFEPGATATSKALYSVYKDWCEDNSYTPLSAKSFLSHIKQNMSLYKLLHSNKIPIGNGKTARGYIGIRLCPRF